MSAKGLDGDSAEEDIVLNEVYPNTFVAKTVIFRQFSGRLKLRVAVFISYSKSVSLPSIFKVIPSFSVSIL